jgi:predicted transcriptional regulator
LVDQNYVFVPPDAPVSRLATIFSEGKVALVEENGRIAAVVTKIDLIDHMAGMMK